MEDKEKLVTERHRYNLESVDRKMKIGEFVVAFPQQQQVLASFTASSIKRHLVLEGTAGTGKTLMALQLAKNLLDSFVGDKEPVLVVTTQLGKESDPIMKYLDTNTASATTRIFKTWDDIMKMFGISESETEMRLTDLAVALANRWVDRQILVLMDEITNRDMLTKLCDQHIPSSVRMILVLNPKASDRRVWAQHRHFTFALPTSFLQVTLTTPYRSTIAITSFARFIRKCKCWVRQTGGGFPAKGQILPEGEFGSDVEGFKPIFFDVGTDKRKLKEAFDYCRKFLGDNATIIYDYDLPSSIESMVKRGPFACFHADSYFGWEAENVVVVTKGFNINELITRARNKLVVILAGDGARIYEHSRRIIDIAVGEGLVDKRL